MKLNISARPGKRLTYRIVVHDSKMPCLSDTSALAIALSLSVAMFTAVFYTLLRLHRVEKNVHNIQICFEEDDDDDDGGPTRAEVVQPTFRENDCTTDDEFAEPEVFDPEFRKYHN
uniref:Uncharacterized protein n=1 Tax=Culex nigripalpus nucleopolyhedrovirus TaxID=130556 RepID=Q99GN8_NPVCN|nr:unknown [Culex nigripalpus nucleopolyhedrovirus]